LRANAGMRFCIASMYKHFPLNTAGRHMAIRFRINWELNPFPLFLCSRKDQRAINVHPSIGCRVPAYRSNFVMVARSTQCEESSADCVVRRTGAAAPHATSKCWCALLRHAQIVAVGATARRNGCPLALVAAKENAAEVAPRPLGAYTFTEVRR
jgi:hypothetical protein